ncbi:DNA recombination protein RmuC [Rubrolithibacter danxiaensis]|uniref:DNA recombination protein RmuC n=1 Tax=Rubrolithibacter danxiaensis TaxID=3390805 RepID=UPI003BF86B16
MENISLILLIISITLLFTSFIFNRNKKKIIRENETLNIENQTLKIYTAKIEERINNIIEEKNNISSYLKNEQERLLTDLEKERAKFLEAHQSLESLKSYYSAQKEKISEQKQYIEELQDKFKIEFENLASQILKQKSHEFTEVNKVNLDNLLNPLKEQIKTFEKKVEDAYDKELRDKISLREELKKLNDSSFQLSQHATNLTNALKGETKTQGNWGEFILESILEKSGLLKNREYFIQQNYKTEEGKSFQPDVIIHLPDEKRIIIDSKVSLVDFEKYHSCDNEQEKLLCLKNHISSIRRHIKGLGDKNYQNLYEIKSLDFVLLFMPVEPAFSLATQHDNQLFTEAFDRNIVIVSPSTLLATLRTIASIWKHEYQNKNALRIAKEGEALYDKFYDLIKDLEKVQTGFESVHKNFNSAFTRLEGKGGIIRRIENLRELGIKGSKKISTKYFDSIEEDEEVSVD